MDNLTHSLVGALIGQAGLKRRTGLAMPALVVGANIPDFDAACFFWLEGTGHLAFRRGITHGPVAWVLLPLILAGLLYAFDCWQARRGRQPEGRLPVRFGWLYGLSLLGTLSHPALDWLNVYGIRLLEPFSSRWFYGDTLFIIDVWLWALLGFGTWLSLRREKRSGNWRQVARAVLAVGALYVGAQAAISWFMASTRPAAFASPVPLASWQREVIARENENLWRVNSDLYGRCDLSEALAAAARPNADLDAFLFWSRAPFADAAADGSVILRDARFTDPRARDRFSVRLPEVRCAPALP
ncbi:metal-dependent hydrolase [Erythrobacteraceae bacterium CFH 75059]|nr:metal-dependent hydrolase [Erythrobacteraceae bacterium CFH 75059]